MQKADEARLIQNMKQGDQASFQTLIQHYHDLLFRTIYTKIQDEELAKDFTQDSFVKIWQKRHILKPEQAFFPILAKIGINLAQDEFRRRQVRHKYQDHVRHLSEKPNQTPEQYLASQQFQTKVANCIANDLPERCRLVFVMSKVEGIGNADIAATLGISKKTVENQLAKAVKILRKKCNFQIEMGNFS